MSVIKCNQNFYMFYNKKTESAVFISISSFTHSSKGGLFSFLGAGALTDATEYPFMQCPYASLYPIAESTLSSVLAFIPENFSDMCGCSLSVIHLPNCSISSL